MKSVVNTATALGLACVAIGCSNVQAQDEGGWQSATYQGGSEQIVGSGNVIQETRDIGAFRNLRTVSAVDVVIRQGATADAVIEAEDNLVDLVELRMENDGTLVVDTSGSFRSRRGLTVYLTVPEIESVGIAGSGDVSLEDWSADRLTLNIGGSGDIRLDGDVRDVTASIAGSGDIDLRRARIEDASARIAGSGDIRLASLRNLQATINGSGDVDVDDVDTIQGVVNGTGEIEYRSARTVTGQFGR
ncbi:GIN domain-containing protein [Aurantiacibacter sp. MUD61]|uniref:GIN domain-containing protein n=1 Tax=Aurantiacibacter sp. MUD61 TaxID=3009083 RepID=UPI0022F10CF5|nr:DUF2807 domain-containing protein [Aurantiacibacter sp. MUD61]